MTVQGLERKLLELDHVEPGEGGKSSLERGQVMGLVGFHPSTLCTWSCQGLGSPPGKLEDGGSDPWAGGALGWPVSSVPSPSPRHLLVYQRLTSGCPQHLRGPLGSDSCFLALFVVSSWPFLGRGPTDVHYSQHWVASSGCARHNLWCERQRASSQTQSTAMPSSL